MAENKTVPVVGPYGEQGTVEEKDLGAVLERGGRVATPEEQAVIRAEERYEKLPTWAKVTGAVTGGGPKPPSIAAFEQSFESGASGGLLHAIKRQAISAIDPKAGEEYAQNLDDLATGYPGTSATGEFLGTVGGAVAGGRAGGLSKLAPPSLVGALGAPVEAGVERALAGVAARGALGRAVTTAAGLGARGAVEGALLSATNEVANQITHDKPVDGEKVFTAAGHGLLAGGIGGAGLGATGSLAMSGMRAAGQKVLAPLAARLEGLTSSYGPTVERAVAATEEAATGASTRVRGLIGAAREGAVGEEAVAGARAAEGGAASGGAGKAGGSRFYNSAPGAAADDIGGAAGRATEAEVVDSIPRRARPGTPNAEIPAVVEAQTGQPMNGVRKTGYEWLWDAVGPTKKHNTDMARRGLTKAELGQTIEQFGIIDPEKGFLKGAILEGGVDDMLAKTELALETKAGPRIGQLTAGAGAVRVTLEELEGTVGKIVKDYEGRLGHESLARQLNRLKDSLYKNIGIDAETGQLSGSVEALLDQRRHLDSIILDGKSTVSTRTSAEVRQRFRNAIEDVVMTKLDEAAKVAGNDTLRADLRAAKRDYRNLIYIRDTLVESTERYATAQKQDLRFIHKVGGAAIAGAGVAGPKGALAGAAVAAAKEVIGNRARPLGGMLLLKLSDMQAVSSAIRSVNEQMNRAAKGVLLDPAKGVAKSASRSVPRGRSAGTEAASSTKVNSAARVSSKGKSKPAEPAREPSVQDKARAIVKWVAERKGRPQEVLRQIQETAEAIAKSDPKSGPKLAQSYTAAALRAWTLLQSKLPQDGRRDPLDPRSELRMTQNQAASIVRTAEYIGRPMKIWEDFENGKVTREGVEVAKTVVPEQYQEFRVLMLNTLAAQLANGKRVPYAHRLKIAHLLDIPADRSFEPKLMSMLQANVTAPSAPAGGGAPAANKPVNLKTQQSTYDRIEAA